MKKIILMSAALVALSATSAMAGGIYVGIGGAPAPVYAAPPPSAYVAEPVYPAYGYPYYYEHHHHYDWRYWHDRHDRRW